MADASLSVKITADIDALRDAFNDARRRINSFDKDTKKSLADIDKGFGDLADNIDDSIKKAAASLPKLGSASNGVSKVLANQAMASAKAGDALRDLGRIAQDAPYGFIGIQNNLNPMLESFERLRKESGSTKDAFKALASGLMGVGGIGFALSLAGSALLLYNQYTQSAEKRAEAHAKAVEKQKNALNEFVDALNGVDRAQVKGEITAQKELKSLDQLYFASRNLNLPMKERIRAGEELLKQYPDTFKNFTAEEIALGKAATAYKQLAKDILETARAQARLEIAVDNEKVLIQNRRQDLDVQKSLNKETKELIRLRKIVESQSFRSGGDGVSAAQSRLIEQTQKVFDLEEKSAKLRSQRIQITKENINLDKASVKVLEDAQSVTPIIPANQKKVREETDKIAEIYKNLDNELKNKGFLESNVDKVLGDIAAYDTAIKALTKEGIDPASERIANLRKEQEKLVASLKQIASLTKQVTSAVSTTLPTSAPELTLGSVNITNDKKFKYSDGSEGVIKGLTEAEKAAAKTRAEYDKLNESIDALVKATISSGLGDLFMSVGEAFASGANVFEAAGDSILKTFGGFLSKFGDLLIEYGAAALIKAKLDLTAFIPGAGIFTAPAAIAAGIALKIAAGAINGLVNGKNTGESKTSSKPRGYAAGGLNLPAGLALVGERGPELINLPTGADVYNNNRTMDMLNGLSRSITQTIIPDVRIGNDAIYLSFLRGQKQYNR